VDIRSLQAEDAGSVDARPETVTTITVRTTRRLRVMLAVALIAPCVAAICASPVDDRYAADPKLRRFVDSMHGETVAIDLGRIVYRKRWNDALDEAMYAIAPRGTWSESHPAWAPARAALADTLRRESVRWLAENRDRVRMIINENSMRELSEDERQRATEFFESTAGKVFRDRRDSFLHEKAYGLPMIIEPESLEQIRRVDAAADKALVSLPEDREGKVVYDFFHATPLGDKVLALQGEHWGRIVANIYDGEPERYVREHKVELSREIRAKVPGIPPPTNKVYLGTLTMGADRSLTAVVEQFTSMRRVGKYTLTYAPDDLHWQDLAAAAPGMKPGETRILFRDPAGHLSDRP
jgi:hypothetical protein